MTINSGYFFILATAFFTVAGQVIIKWRINSIEFSLNGTVTDKAVSLMLILFDKYVFTGLLFALLAALFWLAALTKFNLSYGYPFILALLLILNLLFSAVFLGEPVTFIKMIGILTIVIGLAILWFSNLK